MTDLCSEVLEMWPEFEELCWCEEDGAESLDHVRRKLHVLFMEQDLGAAAVDILRAQQ